MSDIPANPYIVELHLADWVGCNFPQGGHRVAGKLARRTLFLIRKPVTVGLAYGR